MLYESLKKSIAEYNQKHKKDESLQQKTIFRWKIGTLGLCILAIVMIGVLSQLYKQIENEQPYDFNSNFLPTLLTQSNQLDQIPTIRNFIQGFKSSTPKIQFKSSQLIYQRNVINSTLIKSVINQKSNLLYLWEFQNPTTPLTPFKFSFYFKKAFDESDTRINDEIQIIELNVDKASSIFNLEQLSFLRFNVMDNCALYSFNVDTNQFMFGEALRFNQGSGQQVDLLIRNRMCFSRGTEQQSIAKFMDLTGIEITNINQTQTLTLINFEIFSLIPIE